MTEKKKKKLKNWKIRLLLKTVFVTISDNTDAGNLNSKIWYQFSKGDSSEDICTMLFWSQYHM